MNENRSPIKISYFFIVIIAIMMLISLVALYGAIEAYRTDNVAEWGNILLFLSGIALSSYMLMQLKRKPLKLGFEMPKVSTTVQCTSCDYKNIREFQTGDYILKEAGSCPKCNSTAIISSIYKIVEEKEKAK